MPAKKLTKEWIEPYYQHGVNPEQRQIFLIGDIELATVRNAILSVYYLNSIDPKEKMEIFVGTGGGCEYMMFGLYDAINSVECPVHTVAIGQVMSAGPLLVAAGSKGHRYAMPYCQFMVHESWEEWGNERLGSVEATDPSRI